MNGMNNLLCVWFKRPEEHHKLISQSARSVPEHWDTKCHLYDAVHLRRAAALSPLCACCWVRRWMGMARSHIFLNANCLCDYFLCARHVLLCSIYQWHWQWDRVHPQQFGWPQARWCSWYSSGMGCHPERPGSFSGPRLLGSGEKEKQALFFCVINDLGAVVSVCTYIQPMQDPASSYPLEVRLKSWLDSVLLSFICSN